MGRIPREPFGAELAAGTASAQWLNRMLVSVIGARIVSVLALGVLGLFGAAGLRCAAKSAFHERPKAAEAPLAAIPVGPERLQLRRVDGGTNRLILDDKAKAALRESAQNQTDTWKQAAARCEIVATKPIAPGYQAFDWANALATLSLCWHASGDERFAAAALAYLNALIDDRYKVGDGKGGEHVVHHDSGYGIRTFGAYSALGYDWLRKAPGMTPELKQRIISRLDAWLRWYGEKGYLRDKPISNYFWGYLTTLSFAGLAFHGETPAAESWLAGSRELFSKRVLPVFKAKLRGGNWPEGWQYGEYTAAEVALVVEAYKTAAGVDLLRDLPWLAETVPHHVHALVPGRGSVYDGGTWGSHPAKPSAMAMHAVALALEDANPRRASEARWLVRNALPPIERDRIWLALLADRVGAPLADPRNRAQTSLHVPGSGLSFMRNDWSEHAVWASFQAGPRLAEDHQHKDEGHFELWRGSDGLLVDGGGSEGDATINHNTILIDDASRVMTYTPNQGVFGKNTKTTRFADDGDVLVVTGDIADAYAPVCVRDGCTDRAVEKLTRTLVYVRPAVLIIHDDIVLEQEGDGTIWTAHVTTPPSIAGALVSATVGSSRVDIRTLLPDGAGIEARKEPTPSGEGVHRQNQPWGPMWRIEVSAPRGNKQRTFLHFITTDQATGRAPNARKLLGSGLVGARATLAGKDIAVVFAENPNGGTVALSAGVSWLRVVGLTPSKRYSVAINPQKDCTLELQKSDRQGLEASSAGVLKVRIDNCGKTQ